MGKTVLWDTNLPFSRSAGFPNKVTLACPNSSSLDLLACHAASNSRLDWVTVGHERCPGGAHPAVPTASLWSIHLHTMASTPVSLTCVLPRESVRMLTCPPLWWPRVYRQTPSSLIYLEWLSGKEVAFPGDCLCLYWRVAGLSFLLCKPIHLSTRECGARMKSGKACERPVVERHIEGMCALFILYTYYSARIFQVKLSAVFTDACTCV